MTKGRLVKIGDFGLARDIDNDSNYVVRGNVCQMILRHLFYIVLLLPCLCFFFFNQCDRCLSGAFASEVDGTGEYLSGDVHHEE